MKTIKGVPPAENDVESEDELTLEVIASQVVYFPSGHFYRKCDVVAGELKTGSVPVQATVVYHGKPFPVVYLCSLRIAADRLAFFCIHGRWPVGNVRHIDGNLMNFAEYNLEEKNGGSGTAACQVLRAGDVPSDQPGIQYNSSKKHWIAYDESQCGIKHVVCATEREALVERNKIRVEAAFVREFEAVHGR